MEKTIIETGLLPKTIGFVLSKKEVEEYKSEIEQLAKDLDSKNLTIPRYSKSFFKKILNFYKIYKKSGKSCHEILSIIDNIFAQYLEKLKQKQ